MAKPTYLEELRKKIDGLQLINSIQSLDKFVDENHMTLRRDQVDANRLRMSIKFGLLDKVMPSMKAVELSSAPEAPVRFIIDLNGSPTPPPVLEEVDET